MTFQVHIPTWLLGVFVGIVLGVPVALLSGLALAVVSECLHLAGPREDWKSNAELLFWGQFFGGTVWGWYSRRFME